jgi:hypothetical protein
MVAPAENGINNNIFMALHRQLFRNTPSGMLPALLDYEIKIVKNIGLKSIAALDVDLIHRKFF